MNQRREAGMAVCNAPLPEKKKPGYQGEGYTAIMTANQVASMIAQIMKNCDYLGISPDNRFRELDLVYDLNRMLAKLRGVNQYIMNNRSI